VYNCTTKCLPNTVSNLTDVYTQHAFKMSYCFVSTAGLTDVVVVPKDGKTAKLLSLRPVFITRELQYVEEL
jgi:hypothetical protein